MIGEEPQGVYKQRVKDGMDTSKPTVRKMAAPAPAQPQLPDVTIQQAQEISLMYPN